MFYSQTRFNVDMEEIQVNFRKTRSQLVYLLIAQYPLIPFSILSKFPF